MPHSLLFISGGEASSPSASTIPSPLTKFIHFYKHSFGYNMTIVLSRQMLPWHHSKKLCCYPLPLTDDRNAVINLPLSKLSVTKAPSHVSLLHDFYTAVHYTVRNTLPPWNIVQSVQTVQSVLYFWGRNVVQTVSAATSNNNHIKRNNNMKIKSTTLSALKTIKQHRR